MKDFDDIKMHGATILKKNSLYYIKSSNIILGLVTRTAVHL